MTCPRVIGSSLVLAWLVACAHVGTRITDRSDAFWIGDTRIVMRYTAQDAGDAAEVRQALRAAVPVAEGWGPLPETLTVTIHPTHEALEAASGKRGVWWMRAWARRDSVEVQAPRTWSKGAATAQHVVQLLAHELTHCVTYDALGGERDVEVGMPTWFLEGMATSNAGEQFSSTRDGSGVLAANGAFRGEEAPLAYGAANAAFGALEQRFGRARIRSILSLVRGGARFPEAFEAALGTSLAAFEHGWRTARLSAPGAG